MASRLKEDEKNEHVIRGLLKLQPNRRCINCNSLGPQYVCTNFWTFVCTNCSGIHREFNHRVKSVSMAKFTSQEHVYVDRRFIGEKPSDKPPRVKAVDKDDFYKGGGSKSPPYEDAYERRYSDRSSPGGRSPGYDQESRQYGDYRRSLGRPPIINDWRREDRRISDGDYKVERQSPERAKDVSSSSPPVVRSIREILGENVVPLRISEPPKSNSGRPADSSALKQRTASSSNLTSVNENLVDVKLETTKSLIDFDVDPELPVAPSIPQAQQSTVPQPVVQPANSGNDNWASFDVAPGAKATPSSSNFNSLESVLSELSVPASLPAQFSGVQVRIPAPSLTSTSRTANVTGFLAFPPKPCL
uniref:ADP-ribosylation factor GTPase-activating protein AGD14 n=1 Tax=Cajanus cajan TaxID=3821 RepID=A0A151QYJ9_CAJCA|nr:putative ADP-ribosylation factor GTPase-activating protein AGD14 [Cajanus cajan]